MKNKQNRFLLIIILAILTLVAVGVIFTLVNKKLDLQAVSKDAQNKFISNTEIASTIGENSSDSTSKDNDKSSERIGESKATIS